MLMSDDKKKQVTLIMKKLKGAESVEEAPVVDGAEQDDSIAVDTAAEELIAAVESKSPKAVVQAIKSLIELIQSEPVE